MVLLRAVAVTGVVRRRRLRPAIDLSFVILGVLLDGLGRQATAILLAFVLPRAIAAAIGKTQSLIETVSLKGQFLLSFCSTRRLSFQFGLHLGELAAEVFDLPIFIIFNQLKLVMGGLELPLKLAFLFFPVLRLRLEELNFVLEVVHVDFHFMLEANVATHITLQLLDQFLVLAGRAAHKLRLSWRTRPR